MRYLVTGVAGFIGSNILEELLQQGHEVVGLDNLETGHMRNIEPFLRDFEFIEGDIRDPDTCKRACEGANYVIHQAALGSVPRSIKDPQRTHANNATGTLNMLVAARDAEVDGMTFAASSSVYGNTPTLPKVETMPPRPMSPYAVSKTACEMYLKTFADLYDLPAVALRYFNIFGPRQDPDGPYAAVIPKFIGILDEGGTPTIHGDGTQTRDFTYVANAVQANLAGCKRAAEIKGEVINIGCGDRISVNDVYDAITSALGIERNAEYGPRRPGDVDDSLADITKARELLGYEPTVNVREGMKKTVDWFKRQG